MEDPVEHPQTRGGRTKSFTVASAPGPVFARQSSVLSTHLQSTTEKPKRGKILKSKRDVFVAISMSLFYFSVMCAYSMIAPFFPTEGGKKGANQTVVGLIFASFPFVVFLCSPFVGAFLPHLGSKFTLMLGLFVEGTTQILFGFVDLMPDGTIFITFCFLIRIVSAMGSAATSTASMAIVTETFRENMATAMSLLETFGGVGLMIGPPIGGFLFAAGGFKLPFLTVGGIILVLLVPVYLILPSTSAKEVDYEPVGEEGSVSPLSAYKNPAILIVASAIAMGGILIGFLDPTLAIHLKQFNLTGGETGLFFIIAPAMYAVLSPVLGFMADRWDARKMIVAGAFICSVAFFFLGPSPLLKSTVPSTLWLNGVSLGLIGLGNAPFIIPTITDMHRSARKAGMPDTLATHGVISGIFNAMLNVGGIIGPTAAGSFAEEFGFPTACTILAFVLLGEVLLVSIFTIYERAKASDK